VCATGIPCRGGVCGCPLGVTRAPIAVSDAFSCTTAASNTGRKIGVDAGGNIYAVMNCGGAAFAAVSTDGGATFGPPVSLGVSNASELTVLGGPAGTANVGILQNVIFQNGSLLVAHTADAGATWTVNPIGPAPNTGVSLASVGTTLYAGYNWGVVYRIAGLGTGAVSSTAVSLSGQVFGSVLADQGTGAVWLTGDNPNYFLKESTDGAMTFGPELTPPGFSFFSSWTLGNGLIYVTGSSDNGCQTNRIPTSSPGTSTLITGTVTDGPFEEASIAADASGNAYVTAQNSAGEVIVQQIPASATTAGSPIALAASASYPSVIAAPGTCTNALVVFTSGSSVFVASQAF
jgi:hypothetical protein